jgi:hypothetical protein
MRSHQVPVWINPERITFVEPRFAIRGRAAEEVVVGTRVHFGIDTPETLNAMLDLEEPDEVLALLAGRELKIDLTYEAMHADLVP